MSLLFQPVPLQKRVSAFDDPDWLFELKYDGFQMHAHILAGSRERPRSICETTHAPYERTSIPSQTWTAPPMWERYVTASLPHGDRSSRK